jgi:hypothetical protein
MNYDLVNTDVEWLREINAAAESEQALGGVPLSVAAKLTGFDLVNWVGPAALTISSKGKETLSRMHRELA